MVFFWVSALCSGYISDVSDERADSILAMTELVWVEVKVLQNYTGNSYYSYYFNIHLNQFSHSEDGVSTFLRNFGTYRYYTGQKPKRSLLI